MRNAIISNFEKRVFSDRAKLPAFRTGDTVRVHYRVKDREDSKKTRIQQFEGVVIRYKKGDANASFTVRKNSAGGIGVERVFPVNSPNIDKVDVRSRGRVRRSRLFYLRERTGKAARIRSRFTAESNNNSSKK